MTLLFGFCSFAALREFITLTDTRRADHWALAVVPVDVVPASADAGAFLEALQTIAGSSVEIDVLTTMPNRYHSYRASAPAQEERNGVRVFRFPLGEHKSGFLDQSVCGVAGSTVLRSGQERRRGVHGEVAGSRES